jgi:hypothetical protein
VEAVPDPLLLRKRGSAGNRTGTYGSVARNSDHKTTEVVIVIDLIVVIMSNSNKACFTEKKQLFSKTALAPGGGKDNLNSEHL